MSIDRKKSSAAEQFIARLTLIALAVSQIPAQALAQDSAMPAADKAETTRNYAPQNAVERAVFSASEAARTEVMKMLRLTLETIDVEKIQVFAADSALIAGFAAHQVRDALEPVPQVTARWSAGVFGLADDLAAKVEDNFNWILTAYGASNYALNLATRHQLYKNAPTAFGKEVTASGKDFNKTTAAARASGRLAAWTFTPLQNAAMAAEVGIYGPLATSLNAGEKLTTKIIPMLQPSAVRDLLVAMQTRVQASQQSSKGAFDAAMHYTTHYREYVAAGSEVLGERAKTLSVEAATALRAQLMKLQVSAIRATLGKFISERGALALGRTSAGVSVTAASTYGAKQLSSSVHKVAERVRKLGPEEAYRLVEADGLIAAHLENMVDLLGEILGLDADASARIKDLVSKALVGEMLAKGTNVSKYEINIPKIVEEIVGKSKADILKAMTEVLGLDQLAKEVRDGLKPSAAEAEELMKQTSFMMSMGVLLEDALKTNDLGLSESQKKEIRRVIEESRRVALKIRALLQANS
jgi:hypothetical protein